jgi:hypothetical protein
MFLKWNVMILLLHARVVGPAYILLMLVIVWCGV